MNDFVEKKNQNKTKINLLKIMKNKLIYSFNINSSKYLITIVLLICLIYLFFISKFINILSQNCLVTSGISRQTYQAIPYNAKNYLTKPIKSKNYIRFKIALIADMDKLSKNKKENLWISYFKIGYLTYFPLTKKVIINFPKDKILLKSLFSYKKRGMELSELVIFDGKLYTCDDKTGIIFELVQTHNKSFLFSITDLNQTSLNEHLIYNLIPKFILFYDDTRPFKCEWILVKDQFLYVGESNKKASRLNIKKKQTQWVKKISPQGVIENLNWTDNYFKINSALNIKRSGYTAHETCLWSSLRRKWYFMPRKISYTKYNKAEDETKCSNIVIEVDETFDQFKIQKIGVINQYHGFSSSKFLPLFNDEIIVAIKIKEYKNTTSTFILVFNINGEILFPETIVDDDIKYEGIEFI